MVKFCIGSTLLLRRNLLEHVFTWWLHIVISQNAVIALSVILILSKRVNNIRVLLVVFRKMQHVLIHWVCEVGGRYVYHFVTNIYKFFTSHCLRPFEIFNSDLLSDLSYTFCCSFWTWSCNVVVYCSLSAVWAHWSSSILNVSKIVVKLSVWF